MGRRSSNKQLGQRLTRAVARPAGTGEGQVVQEERSAKELLELARSERSSSRAAGKRPASSTGNRAFDLFGPVAAATDLLARASAVRAQELTRLHGEIVQGPPVPLSWLSNPGTEHTCSTRSGRTEQCTPGAPARPAAASPRCSPGHAVSDCSGR